MQYLVNYQFKTSELKNVEKLVEQLQFKPLRPVRMDWECTFLDNCIPGRWSLKIKCGPWKVLKSKMVAIFCMNPDWGFFDSSAYTPPQVLLAPHSRLICCGYVTGLN